MPAITITVHDEEVTRLFKRLLNFTSDLRPVMKNIGEIVLNRVQTCFEEERSPEGEAWAPLKPSTIQQRIRSGYGGEHPILWREGRLGGHFTYDAYQDRVEVSTNVPYAAIHQFGGRAGRGHRAEIPVRPFLGVADEDWDEILDTLSKEIERLAKG